MAHYVFLPVPTEEMKALAAEFIDTCSDTRRIELLMNPVASGFRKGIVRAFHFGCLRKVTDQDTLYVFAHGRGRANSIDFGANRGSVLDHGNRWTKGTPDLRKAYNVDEAAEMLKAEGLVKNFKDLHLLTCGSGLTGDNPNNPTSVPLAKRLRDAMVKAGYPLVRVTGYLGNINTRIKLNGWFTINQGNRGDSTPELASVTYGP